MTLLLTDLDNTLLYSHKHAQEGDVCIEYLNGERQGFMTKQTVSMLEHLPDDLLLIPVTSRSIAQYRRILWPARPPKLAVCANGAVLLRDGEIDAQWSADSRKIIDPCMEALLELQAFALDRQIGLRARMVDEAYLFISCADPESARAAAAQISPPDSVQPQLLGRKLYYIPKGLDKGFAAKKLKERLGARLVLSAGDSEMDLPLLAQADVALTPNTTLAQKICGTRVESCPQGAAFSEFVLRYAIEHCGA